MKKQVQNLVTSKRKKQAVVDSQKENRLLLEQIEVLERQLEFKRSFKVEPTAVNISSTGELSESTAFTLLSDIHFEEVVQPESVLGFNEYTPAIARKRLQQFFYRVGKLIKKEQAQTKIDTLCLAILGDLISNYIHDTLMELNDLPPAEAIGAVVNEIAGGIKYLLANTDVKLDVVCMVGN